jgi:hypothetical protein
LVGTWTATYNLSGATGQLKVTYHPDGTVDTSSTIAGGTKLMTGTWTIDGEVIRYVTGTCTNQSGTEPVTTCTTQLRDTRFSLDGDTLLLTELTADGTAIQTNTFTRSK